MLVVASHCVPLDLPIWIWKKLPYIVYHMSIMYEYIILVMWLHAFISNSLATFNFKRTCLIYNDTVTSRFYLFNYFLYFTQVRGDKWIVKSVAKNNEFHLQKLTETTFTCEEFSLNLPSNKRAIPSIARGTAEPWLVLQNNVHKNWL